MSHIEFLENLIQEYEKDFEEEKATDEQTEVFRKGMIFAWKLAIIRLKRGEE